MSKSIRFETAKRVRRLGLGAVAAPLLAGTMLAGAMIAQPAIASDRSVARASEALAENDTAKAVRYAEEAVQAEPRDASRRTLLGKAYLRDGRLASARQALMEAVSLGDSSPRTALMLALAEIGSGSARSAVGTLALHGNAIPASDRGLAFALAGETARGVEIIASDIRAGNENPKNRQNLAYAFALDGRWREARMMAAQDVPADVIDKRMTEWAMTARPDQVGVRVARLVGAEFKDDAGMPAQLALANFPAAPKPVPAPVMAEAKPAPAPAPVKAAPAPAPVKAAPVKVAEAKVEPKPAAVPAPKKAEPVIVARMDEPAKEVAKASGVKTASVPASQPAMMQMAVIQPTPKKAAPVEAKPVKVAAVAPAKAAPKASAKPAAPRLPTPSASGTHVAQLGSYTSEANARAGWKVFQSRYSNLKGQQPVITKASVDGTDYFRVAAGGFDAKSAAQMCNAVKSSGHGCLPIAKANAKSDKVRVAKAD
ncbi:SPOR domain-containing protein [Croceicoccus sediminis]|uniref:SPOR domain-containing protein n=1 Tax=Croceicoccus sediminis TaxID=2571150 RepID=UPI0011825516|nr:SPOR domain-containing protein [Croceicoccus sediminis]